MNRILGISESDKADLRLTRDNKNGLILDNKQRRFLESVLGIVGESTEFQVEIYTEFARNEFAYEFQNAEYTLAALRVLFASKSNSSVKELGDIIWYAQELVETIEELGIISISELQETVLNRKTSFYLDFIMNMNGMVKVTAELADAAKKYLLYAAHATDETKPLYASWVKSKATIILKVKTILETLDSMLHFVEDLSGITTEDIISVNTSKLKERYRLENK